MQDGRQPNRTTSAILVACGRLITLAVALGGGPIGLDAEQLPEAAAEARAPEAVLAVPTAIGPITYTPGRGLDLGDAHVTLGGYSNLNLVRDEGGPLNVSIDDISFFVVWDPTPRFHLFSELEFEDLAEVDSQGRGGTVNHIFTVERLYGDLTLSDQFNVRAGKFLTPVGRWNLIHAQPLVWTTSRPLATLLPFDPHATGAMLFGSLFPNLSSITYSVYGQFVNQFDRIVEPQLADRGAGARLEYTNQQVWSIGASYLSFSHDGHWQHLAGADGLAQRGPVEVMGEAVFEDGTASLGTQWGFYVQSVIAVGSGVYLVGRYERFAPRDAGAVNLVVPGIAYKPAPNIVLKAEYLVADHPHPESPPGFKSSFAILF